MHLFIFCFHEATLDDPPGTLNPSSLLKNTSLYKSPFCSSIMSFGYDLFMKQGKLIPPEYGIINGISFKYLSICLYLRIVDHCHEK